MIGADVDRNITEQRRWGIGAGTLMHQWIKSKKRNCLLFLFIQSKERKKCEKEDRRILRIFAWCLGVFLFQCILFYVAFRCRSEHYGPAGVGDWSRYSSASVD